MTFSFIVGMKLPTRSGDDNGQNKCVESRAVVMLTKVISSARSRVCEDSCSSWEYPTDTSSSKRRVD